MKKSLLVNILQYSMYVFLLIAVDMPRLKAQGSKRITLNDSLMLEARLIFKEGFKNLNTWQVEQQAGGKVIVREGKLEIEDKGGCTVWLKKELLQPIMIEYDVEVIDLGGPNDRVSDLNCFWMASETADKTFFENHRDGKFSQYDSLQLYYVGLGGHNNTKTRFRRYSGDGNKPLLPEHDLSDHEILILPNVQTKIRIIVYDQIIQYYKNGQLIFNYLDEQPYGSGHFGFRTVNNHMTIDNFKIYELKKLP